MVAKVEQAKVNRAIIKTMVWLNSNLLRFKKLSNELVNKIYQSLTKIQQAAGFKIANAGLFIDEEDITSDCLWAISYIADTDDDATIALIGRSEALPRIINCLGSKELTVFVPALRAIGNMLTTDDHSVIEYCLYLGVLDKLSSLLYSSSGNIIKECCWALSNICAGPSEDVMRVV